MDYENLTLERTGGQGRIGLIAPNRPEKLNELNRALQDGQRARRAGTGGGATRAAHGGAGGGVTPGSGGVRSNTQGTVTPVEVFPTVSDWVRM